MARCKRLPTGVLPRALTREEAAALVRLEPAEYDKFAQQGLFPAPNVTGRIDRVLLEYHYDRLSGLDSLQGGDLDPTEVLEAWRRKRDEGGTEEYQ